MFELYKTEKTIVHYVEANNSGNKIKLIGLFTRDALVVDEGKDYNGIDAIKMWRKKMNATYDVMLEIIGGLKVTNGTLVDMLCTGDLPGSPLIIQHHFIVKNQFISFLKIN